MRGALKAITNGDVACGEVDEGLRDEKGGDGAEAAGGEGEGGVVECGEGADAGTENYALRNRWLLMRF